MTEDERCEGRYPVPHNRDEPFEVTYRCSLQSGHAGPHGASAYEDDDPSTVPEGTGDTWGPPLRKPVGRTDSREQDLMVGLSAKERKAVERIKAALLKAHGGLYARAAYALDDLLAALQQARQERNAMQRRAESAESDWQAIEAQLAAQDAALQQLEGRWREEAKHIDADGDFCCAMTRTVDADQLAFVRAARPKESR